MVIAALLGWAERAGKKAKLAKARSAASATVRAPRAQAAAKATKAPKKQKSASAPAPKYAPSIAIGSEEGVRVTADEPMPVAAAQAPRLKPLDADGLRNAVIWGEILQRKF